ncbi:uncharacterized protein I303_102516 [Kwoniella dejecticola CBS 10117]|uniref:Uncharacterized protein n=1 Tax=Kwoniella dejecticola CBS 10117 TaxID=1296121 RepID=A0A1A6A8Z5_9TREE|nr:uncharacterized protein I303_02530 [Kwoniella dejecticola CBS 10117]OBR86522.1 hypothetical protein I303_02530 [Kwoniella dejecticola CBS 10117]
MGSSSSKAVRKLPTASTTLRSSGSGSGSGVKPTTPPYGGHPPPGTAKPPPEGEEADPFMEAPSYLEQGLGGETRTPSDGAQKEGLGGRGANADINGGASGPKQGQDKGLARGGMGRVEFTGAKDDAIKRDAMDPQFLNNLSRLGQVSIKDAGEFVPAQAQRTLLSRSSHPEFTAPTSLSTPPPANHLTITLLVSLLDRLKTLKPDQDANAVYKEYGVEKSIMDDVRQFVNSVSVAEQDDVRIEDGEEVREMRAVWV